MLPVAPGASPPEPFEVARQSAPLQSTGLAQALPTLARRSQETAASPTPEPSPVPTATPEEKWPESVILIGLDGGQANFIYSAIQQGKMPNLADLAQAGLIAEYAQTVDPSLSALAQNSLVTGSYPARTGIVSNAYHNPNDSFYWYRTGFTQPLDQAEPIWVTASRAGLTTAALFVSGATPGLPGQMAD